MTIGDLLKIVDRIKELELERELIITNRDEYLDPDVKLIKIDNLLSILSSEEIV